MSNHLILARVIVKPEPGDLSVCVKRKCARLRCQSIAEHCCNLWLSVPQCLSDQKIDKSVTLEHAVSVLSHWICVGACAYNVCNFLASVKLIKKPAVCRTALFKQCHVFGTPHLFCFCRRMIVTTGSFGSFQKYVRNSR